MVQSGADSLRDSWRDVALCSPHGKSEETVFQCSKGWLQQQQQWQDRCTNQQEGKAGNQSARCSPQNSVSEPPPGGAAHFRELCLLVDCESIKLTIKVSHLGRWFEYHWRKMLSHSSPSLVFMVYSKDTGAWLISPTEQRLGIGIWLIGKPNLCNPPGPQGISAPFKIT